MVVSSRGGQDGRKLSILEALCLLGELEARRQVELQRVLYESCCLEVGKAVTNLRRDLEERQVVLRNRVPEDGL